MSAKTKALGKRPGGLSDKASDVTNTLARELARLGVTVRLNARVSRLLTEGGRAAGVLLENGEAVRQQVEEAVARADGSGPSVLYIRVSGSGCKVKSSRDNVLGEMLAAMGCVNIADREDSLLEQLSMEVILAEDPDYVFLVYQSADPAVAEAVADEMLRSDPAWWTLRAVREGRCHVMDQKLYNLKPNARWGQAYEQLADILYPAA